MDKDGVQNEAMTSQPDNGYYIPQENTEAPVYQYPRSYPVTSHGGYSINSGDISRNYGNYTHTPADVPLLETGESTETPEGPPPSDCLGCAIFVTLCCCLPLGIIAIVFAVESRSAIQSRDMRRAKEKATTAKHLVISGLVIGCVFTVASVLMYIFVFRASYQEELNNGYH